MRDLKGREKALAVALQWGVQNKPRLKFNTKRACELEMKNIFTITSTITITNDELTTRYQTNHVVFYAASNRGGENMTPITTM